MQNAFESGSHRHFAPRSSMLSTTLRALGENLTLAPSCFRRSVTSRRHQLVRPSASYRTPSEETGVQTEVKKSRFVAIAAACSSADDALAFIKERGDSTASHNCWAFRIGESVYRFSDDGEPGGTAGQPIMSAVDNSGLDHVVVLVTRYYGGTQLGTGGLIRAYGGAAQLALDKAAESAVEVFAKVDAIVNCEAADLGKIFSAMDEFQAVKLDEEYSDDGSVHIQMEIEEQTVETLKQCILNSTSGRAEVKWWPSSD